MKTKFIFFVICFFLFFVFSESLVAQNRIAVTQIPKMPDSLQDEFYMMRKARASYNSGDYGDALKMTEFARETRKTRIEWELYTLQNSFRPAEVRRVGNAMSEILPVLETREDYDAIEIIVNYQKNPRSTQAALYADRLISYISTYTNFPEADLMLGNIYYIEGDFSLAETYYQSAWKNRNLLDTHDEQYEILYKLADLSAMQGNYTTYEEYLTAVVRNDEYFRNSNMQDSLIRIIRLGRKGCVDSLFNLFRPDNYLMMKAYMGLSDLYAQDVDKKRDALYMSALAALTGFTRMYSIVAQRAPDYSYNGLSHFLERAQSYYDVSRWAYENDVWSSFQTLASLAEENGYDVFASELNQAIENKS